MPRLLRHLAVWLSCTAVAVLVVFLAVGFVVDSTTRVPPTVRSIPSTLDVPATLGPSPSPGSSAPADAPAPTPSQGASPQGGADGGAGGAGGAGASGGGTAGAGGAGGAKPPVTPAAVGQPTPVAASPTAVRTAVGAPSWSSAGCQSGSGGHTVQSVGGQVSVRFAVDAVCLVFALPAPGYTTQTAQSDPGTLVVTFTGPSHRSQITATLQPQAHITTHETSW
ncbi:hypothetical protein GCM10009665_77600 [Kitasatospora nipponensis]|uniref:Uncharacterized protein n=1 Tax=Kitasatospora nipponensis TaxID=258049 RepID=A0ABN1TAD6_9ACTN